METPINERANILFICAIPRSGATVGANATIVPGVTLGRNCFVSAGAVITKRVDDYALMAGVPARKKGWMSRHGHRLEGDVGKVLECVESGLRYIEKNGVLCCLDLDEDAPLNPTMRTGSKGYREFKDIQDSQRT